MTASIDDLRGVPLFAAMTDRALQAVAELAGEIEFDDGQALTVEGGEGDAFYLVLDGRVRVTQGGSAVNDLGPGEFIGEIALVDGRPRTATTTADGPVRALIVRRSEFAELIDRFPPVRFGVMVALADRVRRDELETTA